MVASVELLQCPLVEAEPVSSGAYGCHSLLMGSANPLGVMMTSTAEDTALDFSCRLSPYVAARETGSCVVHCHLLNFLILPSVGVSSVSCWDPNWHYTNLLTAWFPVHWAPTYSCKNPDLGFQTLDPKVSVQLRAFSKMVVPVYTPMSSVWKSQLFHILVNT